MYTLTKTHMKANGCRYKHTHTYTNLYTHAQTNKARNTYTHTTNCLHGPITHIYANINTQKNKQTQRIACPLNFKSGKNSRTSGKNSSAEKKCLFHFLSLLDFCGKRSAANMAEIVVRRSLRARCFRAYGVAIGACAR